MVSINVLIVEDERSSMTGTKTINKYTCAECTSHKCTCVCAGGAHHCDGNCHSIYERRKCNSKICVNFKLDKYFKGSED